MAKRPWRKPLPMAGYAQLQKLLSSNLNTIPEIFIQQKQPMPRGAAEE